MTLYINGFIGNDRLLLSSNKKVIQNGGVADFNAFLRDEYGDFVSNQTVYFFEKFEPSLRVSAEPLMTQLGDTLDIYATLVDEDGSRGGAGVTTHFFELVTHTLSVSVDKNILSYFSGDDAILTAFVSDGVNPLDNQSVVFKQGNTVLATETTDSNGEATYTYSSQGIGDVAITVECASITETITIEDCDYYNTNEITRTSTNGSTIYDNSLSQSLSTNYEISFDVWSNNSTSGSEHRFFLMPKSQWSSGTTQPRDAIFVDLLSGNKAQFGRRENNSSTQYVSNIDATGSTYHRVKYVKTSTSIEMYIDDDLKATQTFSWIDNYSDYCLSMMRWSASGTSRIRNVKFKKL